MTKYKRVQLTARTHAHEDDSFCRAKRKERERETKIIKLEYKSSARFILMCNLLTRCGNELHRLIATSGDGNFHLHVNGRERKRNNEHIDFLPAWAIALSLASVQAEQQKHCSLSFILFFFLFSFELTSSRSCPVCIRGRHTVQHEKLIPVKCEQG